MVWLHIGACVCVRVRLQQSFISRARTSRAGPHGSLGRAKPRRRGIEKSFTTRRHSAPPALPASSQWACFASLPGENSEMRSKPCKPSQVRRRPNSPYLRRSTRGQIMLSSSAEIHGRRPGSGRGVSRERRAKGRRETPSTICCCNKASHVVGRQRSCIVFCLLHVFKRS